MIKAVLFNLEGTLVYNVMGKQRYNDIMDIIGEHNGPVWDRLRREVWSRKNLGDEEFFGMLVETCGLSDKLVPRLIEVWNQQISYMYTFTETETVLFEMQKQGLQLALVSNTVPITHMILDQLGLRKFFDAIVLSCDTGLLKPEHGIYEMALEKLGVSLGEALFVGDENDVFRAREMGMRAVRVDRAGDSVESISDLREITEWVTF